MIYETLHSIVRELNEYLQATFKVNEACAILNAVLNQDGTIPEHCLNKIVLSLVNLEHDSNTPYNPVYKGGTSEYEEMYTPFNFNLDVLVTSIFENKNYDEGLKFLSQSLCFFQGKPVFSPDNTTHMSNEIRQVSVELIRLSYHEEHSLWGAMGARYMPSVLFKIRLVSFQSGAVNISSPRIKNSKESAMIRH